MQRLPCESNMDWQGSFFVFSAKKSKKIFKNFKKIFQNLTWYVKFAAKFNIPCSSFL